MARSGKADETWWANVRLGLARQTRTVKAGPGLARPGLARPGRRVRESRLNRRGITSESWSLGIIEAPLFWGEK